MERCLSTWNNSIPSAIQYAFVFPILLENARSKAEDDEDPVLEIPDLTGYRITRIRSLIVNLGQELT
jgi:hypothetical protein